MALQEELMYRGAESMVNALLIGKTFRQTLFNLYFMIYAIQ